MKFTNNIVRPYIYEVKFVRLHAEQLYKEHTIKFLQRRGFPIIVQGNGHMKLSEDAIRELLNYCADFSLMDSLAIKLAAGDWKPISEI